MTTPCPEPISFDLPDFALTVRGQRWPGGANRVVLVHAPGEDLDTWGDLPDRLAAVGYGVLAYDLPGHGLSDGEWEPRLLPLTIAAALAFVAESDVRRTFLITAGAAAAGLSASSIARVDAWIAVSPVVLEDELTAKPSIPVPKLVLVGAGDPEAVAMADRFYRWSTGWTVLSSFGGAENGTRLLHGPWGAQVREQILKFLNDYRIQDPASPRR